MLLHEDLEILVDVLQREAAEGDRATVPFAGCKFDVEEARDFVGLVKIGLGGDLDLVGDAGWRRVTS